MKKEDILSITDWIKISIKFSGTCSVCKKRIDSGNYGYWSKSSKSVLHDSCYISLFSSSFEINNSNDVIKEGNYDGLSQGINNNERNTKNLNKPNSIVSVSDYKDGKSLINKQMKKKKCFICNEYVNFDNKLVAYLLKLNEINDSKSDIVYCYDCLENFDDNVFEKYKDKFMQGIR